MENIIKFLVDNNIDFIVSQDITKKRLHPKWKRNEFTTIIITSRQLDIRIGIKFEKDKRTKYKLDRLTSKETIESWEEEEILWELEKILSKSEKQIKIKTGTYKILHLKS